MLTMPSVVRRDERGAAAVMLLITAMIMGFAVFLLWAAPMTQATDAKSKNQAAADAAALAAAEAIRGDLLSALTLSSWNGNWNDLIGANGSGHVAASDLAHRNGVAIVDYFSVGFETYVAVESPLDARKPHGKKVRSNAKARFDLPHCVSKEEDPPEDDEPESQDPGDDEDEDEEEEEEPPPPPITSWTCGGIEIGDTEDAAGLLAALREIITGSHAKLIS